MDYNVLESHLYMAKEICRMELSRAIKTYASDTDAIIPLPNCYLPCVDDDNPEKILGVNYEYLEWLPDEDSVIVKTKDDEVYDVDNLSLEDLLAIVNSLELRIVQLKYRR